LTHFNNKSGGGKTGIDDSWERGDHYEYFMGRWSRLVAHKFIDWLAPSSGLKWLDIGCGSGALSEAILDKSKPSEVMAVDQSEGFVNEIQSRLGNRVRCRIGDALALPVEYASVQFAVSGLVLNFIAEPVKALTEMKRVIAPGGTGAGYVWDYSGKMEFLNIFWDAAVAIDSKASDLHEGKRFRNTTEAGLRRLFEDTSFLEVESSPIEIEMQFRDFDDYWKPFLGGQGPAPSYLMSLNQRDRQRLRDHLVESLPIQHDGSIRLEVRAWAVRGRREK